MMKKLIYTAAIALLAPAAIAQDLSTEVIVQRSVVPAERAATRPSGLFPAYELPTPARINLGLADYSALAAIEPSFTRLDPAEGALLPEKSPWRGYVTLGYFPIYNLGISAGYRAIDTEDMRLNVYAQFDGEHYKASDDKYTSNLGTIGADFGMKVNSNSHFAAGMSVCAGADAIPWRSSQSIAGGSLGAAWHSAVGGLSYRVGAKAEIDSYGGYDIEAIPSLIHHDGFAQQRFGFDAAAALPLADEIRVALDIEGDFLHSGGDVAPTFTDFTPTLGAIGFTPSFRAGGDHYEARLGVKVDLGTGGHDSKIHVAPDVLLAWMPAQQFALSARFGGGSVLNSVRDLRVMSPYITAADALGRSHVPYIAEAEMRVGPFVGFTASIFGGYAKADRWAMPAAWPSMSGQMVQTEIKGYHAGIKLAYEGSIINAEAQAEIAPSDAEKGWYLWRDRAKYAISASADYTGFDGLAVGLGYSFRGHRQAFYGEVPRTLGCQSELSAHASYSITEQLSVTLAVENILCRRFQVLPDITSNGLHGLVGVAYHF